jgi:uncharacterized protein YrrD
MRKGRDIVGKSVIAYNTGEKFETVTDLVFDQVNNVLLGFLVDEGGWFTSAKVIPLSQVQAIGRDAIIVATKDAVAEANSIPAIESVLNHNNILKDTRIMTVDGRDLGTMVDLFFDETTGAVEGYEVSGGMFADAYSGRSFVPAPQTIKIGEDVAFIPSETADLMEEQVGGVKAAFQATSEKVQEVAHSASTKAQELAQTAGTKLQDAQRNASAAVTNAIIEPGEQREFVIGKTSPKAITAPDGTNLVAEGQLITPAIAERAESLKMLDDLYRATGGNLAERLGERVGSAVASVTVEQTKGQRVRQMVQTEDGYIIAAVGQIVTPLVIERAKTHGQEQALLQAVGLTTTDTVKSQTGALASSTGDRLKSTAGNVADGAKSIWGQVQETASDLKHRGERELEERRIKGALGRPVNRVILDRRDEVILNVAELITHQAVETARQEGVLDILLSSVYTETPQISLEEMKAPEEGRAALH